MLQGESAEIADACSRVCVMRTEDYTLLRDIKQVTKADRKRSSSADAQHGAPEASEGPQSTSSQRHALDQRYLRHVCGEFREREAWRHAQSQRLLARLKEWAQRYYRRESLAEAQAQLSLGDASSLYADLIQSAHHLDATVDLTHSPFASPEWPSRYLYDRSSVLPSTISSASVAQRNVARYVGRAQQVLFPATIAKLNTSAAAEGEVEESASPPSQADAITDALYPLAASIHNKEKETASATNDDSDNDETEQEDVEGEEAILARHQPRTALDRATTIKPASRDRLRDSRHVWSVLLLLWCHTLMQRQLVISSLEVAKSAGSEKGAQPAPARRRTGGGDGGDVDEEETLLMGALLTSTEGFLSQQRAQFLKVLEAVEALATA